MADSQKRLILGNGERLVKAVEKPRFGRSPEPPRTYDEARSRVKEGIRRSLEVFDSLPARLKLPDEAVFCLRLHPDAQAKSYEPELLFDDIPEVRKVGSRAYRVRLDDVAETQRVLKKKESDTEETTGRLVFVQSTPQGFRRFIQQLDRSDSNVRKVVQDEIRCIERFDTLSVDEQIVGFDSKWKEGRVELVLHPSRLPGDRQLKFVFELFDEVGISQEKTQVRPYPVGPTFVSCRVNRDSLMALEGANPLRTVHPLIFGGITDLRHAASAPAPKPTGSTTRSTIKVGMFDGGVDTTVPLLRGHVEVDASLEIKTPERPDFIAHGTAVAGVLLHGQLNGLKAADRVRTPPVSVVSIRALPTSDPYDIDLYEAIDVVENAVPNRSDIKVFNLSFGPRGPIRDDAISRFTYVLDALAVTHKVGFFVAVGNDGEVAGQNRIQAPSDLVHGLGVGAFAMNGEEPVHAAYSCRGPGRECGKIKPDLAAFGGDENGPMHLVGTTHGEKVLQWGTSFACPIAARLGAQASTIFERSSALLARALLIHTAIHPDGSPDHLLGHGCILPDIGEVLACEDQTVTVVFQGDILPSSIVKLPIPWPTGKSIPGKVQVTWTVGALAPIEPNHPDDYTCGCLEDTFYPHSRKFYFSPPKGSPAKAKKKSLNVDSDAAEVAKLKAAGWQQSSFPLTESGNDYADEMERRLDCKWEPVVRRSVSKLAKNLHDPFLTLHALGRHGTKERFDYVAIVTLRAESFVGDLYSEIRQRLPVLSPIRVRTEAEIRVEI